MKIEDFETSAVSVKCHADVMFGNSLVHGGGGVKGMMPY